jgi:hypothetical protein
MPGQSYLTRLAKSIADLTEAGMLDKADSEQVRQLADGEVTLDALREELSAAIAPRYKCAWFAMCPNEATLMQSHPILGEVPICARCKAKYDSLG